MATKRKRKNTGGKPLIITFVCLVAVTLAVFGVFFGADKYERSTHPMLYSDLVDRYSSQYKLDKYAVYSFICVESGFNENSESYLGARGLMQIMPATGEWIAGKLDDVFDVQRLYEPSVNLRYGCWYLRFLLDRYDGDMRTASTAYHQGQGRVDEWLQDPQYSQDGRTLTAISSAVTDTYVNRIMESYEHYKELY